MALIKTIAEIKEVLPRLVSNTSNTTTLPNFDQTEYKYIIPIIGPTLYNTLVTNYQGNTLTDDEIILVKKLRQVIAAYGYYDDIGLYLLMIGDAGVANLRPGATDQVYAWKVQELKKTLLNKAFDGIEVLLNYLFDNKDLYLEWTDSDQYKKISSMLIRTGTDFSEQYLLFQPQRTYFAMLGQMNDVQKLFIIETIGKELFEYLRDLPTPASAYQACIDLLKKSIAFFTVMKACNHFSVQFTDNGFTIRSTENVSEGVGSQPIDESLLTMKIKNCESEGNAYLDKANDELVKLYSADGTTDEYKTAFDKGPLKSYIKPEDRTSGNENRKIYALP